jgi:hypothetical protein
MQKETFGGRREKKKKRGRRRTREKTGNEKKARPVPLPHNPSPGGVWTVWGFGQDAERNIWGRSGALQCETRLLMKWEESTT